MSRYFDQRDITNRLIAARFERKMTARDIADDDDGELPPELLDLIEAYYRCNGLLTQTPITDEYF